MSKLEQLINELCPAGVEYRSLEKICKFQNGFAFKSSKFLESGLPILRITNIVDGKIDNNSLVFFNPADYSTSLDSYIVKRNNIVIAMSGATTGKIGYNYSDNEYYLNQRVGMFIPQKEKLNNRYLYHWLIGQSKNIYNISSGSGAQPNLSSVKMMNLEIPLPPLPVQEEIVRILDTFTELTAELTAELTMRKQQYEYYRDSLLTFGENVEWRTLGEVGDVKMCKRILKNQTSDVGDVPFYKIGTFGKEPNAYISRETFEEYKSKYSYPKIGEILISASGTIGRAVIFDGQDSYFQDSNIVWIDNDESQALNKYLFHFYKIVKWAIAEGGTIQRLYNDNLKKTKIPIPPLEEQQRIVDILDRFDTLCNDISQGLPAEIKMRQQQYEYYRNKLLAFEKAKV